MADPAYIVDGVLTDGEAWVAVDSDVLTGTATSITWTSTDDGQVGDWSQYMDLVVVIYGQCAYAAYDNNSVRVRLNNVTSSSPGYAYQTFNGDGASATATSGSLGYMLWGDIPGVNSGTNNFGCVIAQLFDINSGKYKSIITQAASDRDGAGNVSINAFTAKKSEPITEIDIEQIYAVDYTAGSMFSLFGVLPRMVA